MSISLLRIVSQEEFLGWNPSFGQILVVLGIGIMEEIHYIEQFFIKMKSFYAFITQVCFFILVDLVVSSNEDYDPQNDKSVVTALTTILFYSVFGYFVSRMREIFHTNRLHIFRSFQTSDQLIHWVCKIILEWAKAVIIVMCLREQGIKYQPSLTYSIFTFIYYICSEKIFIDTFKETIEFCNIDCLEHMEHLYVPMALNILAISLGIVFSTCVCIFKFSSFVLVYMYFLIYIRLKDFYFNQWRLLHLEMEIFRSFRVATNEEIYDWADICAICLNSMSRARITPCNHLFHPQCLKQCLKSSMRCPLCKSHFLKRNNNK